MDHNHDLLKRIAEPMAMDVSRETYERFIIYKDLLQEWNEKMNLTTIIDENEIFLKHFGDSITIFRLKEVKTAHTVIDVGTGAGFPGIPMKFLKPSIDLTCLDPLNKRLNFLRTVAKETAMMDIQFIHGRAEDVSRETSHRDRYELAVSRAVAVLPILVEYCMPFVAPKHHFVAMKGPGIQQELELNPGFFKELSSELIQVDAVTGLDEFEHNLVLIRKTKPTREKYPRKFVQIKKDNEQYRDQLKRT